MRSIRLRRGGHGRRRIRGCDYLGDSSPMPTMPPPSYLHVLVVDDSLDDRELYATYLLQCGLTVATAETGLGGIEMAEELRPAVIVMDLSMPGLDGWRATRILKSQASTKAIPVVALTGQAFPGGEEEA